MRKEKFQRKNMIILQNIVPFVLTQLAYYSTLAVPEYSNHFVCRAGQYLNTLYLNTVFKYIYCIYTLYLNTFFDLYLITVFKYL